MSKALKARREVEPEMKHSASARMPCALSSTVENFEYLLTPATANCGAVFASRSALKQVRPRLFNADSVVSSCSSVAVFAGS